MKDNKSNISLLVFLSYAFKGLLVLILSLSIAIYKSIKYIYLGIKLLFKVNYIILKKAIETLKTDNLQVNNEQQLSLASKKEDNVKVIPNMVETKEELPWRKTKNNNKKGTRNIKPNDVLLDNQVGVDLPINENILVPNEENNLIDGNQFEIEQPEEEKVSTKKQPWWKKIGKKKKEESIIPIEEEKPQELSEEEINNSINEITTDEFNDINEEIKSEETDNLTDENQFEIEQPEEEKISTKKQPWWKKIGKKKKEELIIPIEEEKINETSDIPEQIESGEETIEEKINKIKEITTDEFDDINEEIKSEETDNLTAENSFEIEQSEEEKVSTKKQPWWKKIGKKKKEESIIPIEEEKPQELSEKEIIETSDIPEEEKVQEEDISENANENIEDKKEEDIFDFEPMDKVSSEEELDVPIIEIEEKKIPWWKKIGKKKNVESNNIEELDVPIIEIEEKKTPWWKKIGKKKKEELMIPIEEEKLQETTEEEKINETSDIPEEEKIQEEDISEKTNENNEEEKEEILDFEPMDKVSSEEELDVPIIPIEERKQPWWKRLGKKKKEESAEELFKFEPMDKVGESTEEIIENNDEIDSDLFNFESEDNISDGKEKDIDGIFKESDEKSAREFVNKKEQKKEEKRRRKEEKQKRKEELAREKAEKRRKKKNDKNTYINDKVKLEKTPFKQKIKDIGVGISTAAVGLGDKVKNNIFSKNRRNQRDLKRKVLLIDFEGKDAEKTENKLLYEYVAKDKNGKIVKDYFNAYSKVEVHSYLLSEGYEVYSIKTNKLIQILHAASNTNRTRFKNKDLIFFLTQLSTYLKAGIPLVDSLRIVARQYNKKNYQKIFRSIIYELSVGENFSSAMEKQNIAFPKLLINMVKTAEMTGSLPEVLDDMAEYYTEAEATRKQMITAMTYPMIVFTFSISVMIFIMVYVVPKFVQIYDAMENTELPSITKSILGISSFIRNYYILLILAVILLIILMIVLYRKVKQFRTICQWLLMKVPVIKNTIIYNEVTMFTKTFSSLLAHNVPITDSMEILNQITNNEIYKMLILDTITNLAKGGKISDAFKDHWAFPVPAYEMIVTGEATGELAEMMAKVSSYYQELHKNSVTRIKTFIEPVLTIFLTVGVGIIILSVILPMFNMYSAVADLGE